MLVPVGLLTIWTQLFGLGQPWREGLTGMVAALVPMVPEGLVLMTSIAFAVGVIRLGQRQCLVQELPAIEGLARVDVVCADKTGTLTESGMRLSEVRGFDGSGMPSGPAPAEVTEILAQLTATEPNPNASLAAIAEAIAAPSVIWTETHHAPFTSARKWSGSTFDGQGTWVLGAPDVLAPEGSAAREAAEEIGPHLRLHVSHAHGRLGIGDLAVVVAAGTPHRDEAFRACRKVIEIVKHESPIWKKEHYSGGDSEWSEGCSLCVREAEPMTAELKPHVHGPDCGHEH